jgi:hypothetical protein
MNAFATGSRAYGSPRKDSDLDLVVLVDWEAFDLLRDLEASQKGFYKQEDDYGIVDSACLRFGPLNLIVTTDPAIFAAWQVGTATCQAKRAQPPYSPISREEAKAVFTSLFQQVGVGTIKTETALPPDAASKEPVDACNS